MEEEGKNALEMGKKEKKKDEKSAEEKSRRALIFFRYFYANYWSRSSGQ